MKLNFLKTFAAVVAVVATGSAAIAQNNYVAGDDISLASYEDLLTRVQGLEAQLASKSPYQGVETCGYQVGGGCAPDGCGLESACCQPECNNGGCYVMYESVIVAPHFGTNTAYVIDNSDNDTADTMKNVQFDWDLEYSPRIELGYISPCTNVGWRARYWHFEHSNGVRAVNNTDADDVFNVEPQDDPDIQINVDDGDILESTHSLALRVFDLEGMRRAGSNGTTFTGSAGLRYVRMDQTLNAGDFDGANGNLLDSLRYRHNFEGIGPTCSVEALRRIRCSNWGVFGNLRGSLLYGTSDIDAVDYNYPSGTVNQKYDMHNPRDLMGVAETQLGVDYRRCCSSGHTLFLRAAWELQYWANGGSGNGQHGDDDDRIPNTETDMGFMGVTASAGVDF